MDTRRLRYFVEIVDAGSLTRAASRLGVAQPALSQQLGIIEEAVGVMLLTRTPRGVVPTEAGQLFYARAQLILRLSHSIREEVRHLEQHPIDTVSIGIPFSTSHLVSVPLFEAVRSEHLASACAS
ncbi:MAG TPA: LysR family transcriptional regulator [Geminicoccus sp.]|uniref:LysR family transcriptional regulator n=1 Tax=Geminicoccus sp. TaxID=2024832 RepID=UPI002BA39DF5|nr:LysR family transcriptional regulator [Geminicoccus sp.]HWL68977.1 LysR family transcriptional regulator [Geminicoccus sp.]